MTPRERVWAALRGDAVDRPPVSFWGHFYDRESSAEDLVHATLENHGTYDWDWIKLNPRKHYHVEPWGVSYRYSGRNEKPVQDARAVDEPRDWSSITARPHDRGALGEQIEAVRMLRAGLPADVPLIQTVFTPLAILGELVDKPETLRAHMRSHPDQVRAALETVTTTFEAYVGELARAGADGIFLATVDWGTHTFVSAQELKAWSRPHDLRLLAAADKLPFNVLHVCKSDNLLFEFADYPVRAFSWAATDPTNPTLAQALRRLDRAVMGGISQDGALQSATPAAALAEYRAALEETGGRRWLVAPGCSIPHVTPHPNLKALREAVEATRFPETARADAGSSSGRHEGTSS